MLRRRLARRGARSRTPGRTPRRARGSRRRWCASGSATRSTMRFDLIGVAERLRRRRRAALLAAPRRRATRATCGCASRPRTRTARSVERLLARGHRALHLRAGRRRRRAHEPAPRALDTLSCFVPARAGAGALRDPGVTHGPRVPLHDLAHGRTGDKGDRSNISVIAYRPEAVPVASSSRSPRRGSQRRSATAARRRQALPAAEAARDELRDRRRARRRRQRLAQPRHPRQELVFLRARARDRGAGSDAAPPTNDDPIHHGGDR